MDNDTGEAVAIKIVNLENNQEELEEIRKEVGVLKSCVSPNIVRCRGSYVVSASLWIVMDYCALGSLRQLIVGLVVKTFLIDIGHCWGNRRKVCSHHCQSLIECPFLSAFKWNYSPRHQSRQHNAN